MGWNKHKVWSLNTTITGGMTQAHSATITGGMTQAHSVVSQ